MGTLSRLLLAENFDIKFFECFCKNDRDGGGGGGVSYFSCMKEGTRVSHAKFQVSMSICSQTVVFYKILGGGGGGPIILLVQKALVCLCLFMDKKDKQTSELICFVRRYLRTNINK